MIKRVFFRTGTLVLVVVLVMSVLLTRTRRFSDKASTSGRISVTEAMSDATGDFARADAVREFKFPEDHSSHDDYKIEWWYFTGNLSDGKGNHFGYQFTIFRNALSRDSLNKDAGMAAKQLYFAHFAVSDIKNGKFYFSDKYSRGVEGLAGASPIPLKVHVEDWKILSDYTDGDYEMPDFRIIANADGNSIDLYARPVKNLVKHGVSGLSQKSNTPGNASYYYSYTRLETSGEIRLGNKRFDVTGFSWYDREWSTSALDSAQSGWDWFSLQLDNGYDLMYFMLRNHDGSFNFGKGTMVAPDGKAVFVSPDDVLLEVKDTWKSDDGQIYPSAWRLKSDKYDLDLVFETRIPNQELKLILRYYEGSVKVTGTHRGNKISGLGYAELTGYAK